MKKEKETRTGHKEVTEQKPTLCVKQINISQCFSIRMFSYHLNFLDCRITVKFLDMFSKHPYKQELFQNMMAV